MSIPLKSRNQFNFSAPNKCRFVFKPIILEYSSKQSGSEVAARDVLLKKVFLKLRKFYRKSPVLESLFNNVGGLQAYNFIKKMQKQPSEVFYKKSCS